MNKTILVLGLVIAMAGVAGAGAIQLPGLVHEWEFEGNTNDTSGSGNHGTVVGSEAYSGGVDGGQAFHFSGGTKVEETSASNLPLSAGPDYPSYGETYSMNVYIYIDGAYDGDRRAICGFSDYDNCYRAFTFKWNNFSISHQNKSEWGGIASAWANEWIMLTDVYVRRAGSYKADEYVYVNGELVGDTPPTSWNWWVYDGAAKIFAGDYVDQDGLDFNGLMDGFQIYNRALTQDDIDTLYSRIPEPATIALLGLGGLALIRRKR